MGLRSRSRLLAVSARASRRLQRQGRRRRLPLLQPERQEDVRLQPDLRRQRGDHGEGKIPTSQAHTRRESVVGHWSMGERVVVALVKFGASSKLGTLSREPYNVVYVYRITRLL